MVILFSYIYFFLVNTITRKECVFMKKVLLLIAVVAVLSGCGTNDKLTCTYDNTVGDVTSKTEYVIEYRNNNIKKIRL